MNEILLQKQATIRRYIIKMNEVYNDDSKKLSDLTRQDPIILNLQQACFYRYDDVYRKYTKTRIT